MENPIKIDDLGVPLFLETPIGVLDYGIIRCKHLGKGKRRAMNPCPFGAPQVAMGGRSLQNIEGFDIKKKNRKGKWHGEYHFIGLLRGGVQGEGVP